jgi:hypothetical protein
MTSSPHDSSHSRDAASPVRCLHCGAAGGVPNRYDDQPFFEDEVDNENAIWLATIPVPLLLGVLLLPHVSPTTTAIAIAAVLAIEVALIVGLRRFVGGRRRSSQEAVGTSFDSPSASPGMQIRTEPVRDHAVLPTSGPTTLASSTSASSPPSDPSPPAPTTAATPALASNGLDEARLTQRRRESEEARQTLQNWNDTSAVERPIDTATAASQSSVASAASDQAAASTLLGALDEEERLFAVALAQRPQWSPEEFSGLARSYGVMPSVATDIINEASLRLFSVAALQVTSTSVVVDMESFRRTLS